MRFEIFAQGGERKCLKYTFCTELPFTFEYNVFEKDHIVLLYRHVFNKQHDIAIG